MKMELMMFWLPGFYGVLSLITFGVYWWDKRAAIKGNWRIRERTLHWLALFGGWPGAWLAQLWFRHKFQKLSFRRVFRLTVAGNLAMLAAIVWLLFRG
ncbi:DUF1294 domain-containing protein [Oceanisphaera sp. KMM 10153]|uniref:DUF1294 domain-containing protein n=1 Tax=Oceanisphaera submarina TaxID=3390193 RepID=UPI003975EBA7